MKIIIEQTGDYLSDGERAHAEIGTELEPEYSAIFLGAAVTGEADEIVKHGLKILRGGGKEAIDADSWLTAIAEVFGGLADEALHAREEKKGRNLYVLAEALEALAGIAEVPADHASIECCICKTSGALPKGWSVAPIPGNKLVCSTVCRDAIFQGKHLNRENGAPRELLLVTPPDTAAKPVDLSKLASAIAATQDKIFENTKPGGAEAIMHPKLAEKLGLEGETIEKCSSCDFPGTAAKCFECGAALCENHKQRGTLRDASGCAWCEACANRSRS